MKYETLEPGRYYHIYNRGNNKENLFIEEKNYSYFLNLLKKHILPIAEIHCYCLLPNHFHLLIRTKENLESKIISQGFSNVFNAYAKAINKGYERSGSLFKRKFSRIKIEDEAYVRNLILYIHTNAQYHKITDNFQTYPHSSYAAFLSEKPTNISKDYILELFSGKENFISSHQQKAGSLSEKLKEYTLEWK
ncbi:transposase [Aquimarina sp. U1-2]|uniref:transposase n=1 Tax=Aquimarina sp. U1-2 TaxID=2823141 RepID=UPI001AECE48B|nr:transposase [Aquimarina sp. U1-2]MBP2831180.1 transposase [Aquimarina sp. U1-2]